MGTDVGTACGARRGFVGPGGSAESSVRWRCVRFQKDKIMPQSTARITARQLQNVIMQTKGCFFKINNRYWQKYHLKVKPSFSPRFKC